MFISGRLSADDNYNDYLFQNVHGYIYYYFYKKRNRCDILLICKVSFYIWLETGLDI